MDNQRVALVLNSLIGSVEKNKMIDEVLSRRIESFSLSEIKLVINFFSSLWNTSNFLSTI